MRMAVFALVGLIAAQPAFAGAQTQDSIDSVGSVLRAYDDGPADDKTIAELIVRTALDSFGYANADLAHNGRQALFCPPPLLGITNDQAVSMVRQLAQADRAFSGAPITATMLLALKRTFPCANSRR